MLIFQKLEQLLENSGKVDYDDLQKILRRNPMVEKIHIFNRSYLNINLLCCHLI